MTKIFLLMVVLYLVSACTLSASELAPADTVYPRIILIKGSIGANNINFDMGGGVDLLYDRSYYSIRFIRGFENHALFPFLPLIEAMHPKNSFKSPLETTHELSFLCGRMVIAPLGHMIFSGGIGAIQFFKRERFIRDVWGEKDVLGLPSLTKEYETRSYWLVCLPYEVQYLVFADPIHISVSFYGNVNGPEDVRGLKFNIAWGISL